MKRTLRRKEDFKSMLFIIVENAKRLFERSGAVRRPGSAHRATNIANSRCYCRVEALGLLLKLYWRSGRKHVALK